MATWTDARHRGFLDGQLRAAERIVEDQPVLPSTVLVVARRGCVAVAVLQAEQLT